MDSGYFRHPDLAEKVVSEHDCDDDRRASPLGVHGAHVAGIVVAAADNGRGAAGMAPEAAPHVAGALDCARANGKNRTEARRDLFESARDRGRPGRDGYFGRGALDMAGTVR